MFDCSICLQRMSDPVQIRCTALHAFDRDCIQSWFDGHHDCPLCKSVVVDKTLTKSIYIAESLQERRIKPVSWSISLWSILQKIWQWFRPIPRPPSLIIQLSFRRSSELTTTRMVVDQIERVPVLTAVPAMSNLIERVVKFGETSIANAQVFNCKLQRKNRLFMLHVAPSPGRPINLIIDEGDARGLAGPYFPLIK